MKTLFDFKTREEMADRINLLTSESQAQWGKMNVSQMLCHCTDGIKMATGEREVTNKSNFLLRNIIKPLIIYVLPMPKGAPTAKELDQMKGGTTPTEFENDRKDLLDCMERFCSLQKDFKWSAHPMFGQMNHQQWGLLAHKHIDHHLKQFGV